MSNISCSYSYNVLVLLFFIQIGYTQQNNIEKIPDSLVHKSFEELWISYKKAKPDTLRAKIYAEAHLIKAQKENDTINLARSYRYLYMLVDDTLGIEYANNLIELTKNKDNFYYPAGGYLLKGESLYRLGDYIRALDNYIQAKKYAKRQKNIKQQIQININIGALKNRWGIHSEAVDIFKKELDFIKKQSDYRKKFRLDYLATIHNLAISYIQNKQWINATKTIHYGKIESLALLDSLRYYRFIMNDGSVEYLKGNYQSAIDSMDKALPYLSKTALAMAHFYKGKSYIALDKPNKSIPLMKTVDSIYQVIPDKFPEIREVYGILLADAKKKKNIDTQLYYINELMHADSLLNKNFKYLNNTIIKKYDVPQLLSEKEKLTVALQQKNEHSKSYILALLIFILILSSVTLLYYLRQKKLKKNFEAFMEQHTTQQVASTNKEPVSKSAGDIGVPEQVVMEILNKLKKFEDNHTFLQHGMNQNKLAKLFRSNSSYISKVVNQYKEKTFANYINDLRIDYIVAQLQIDRKLRSYSIESIAKEAGFSNVVSFNRAFTKKTNTKASYFIQQLRNKQ